MVRSRESVMRDLISEIKNSDAVWSLAQALSPADLEELLVAGLKAQLPVVAASHFAAVYKSLEMSFNNILSSSRNDKLKRLYRRFMMFKRLALESIIEKSLANNYDFIFISSQLEKASEALQHSGYHVVRVRFSTMNRAMVGAPPLPFNILFEAGTAMHPLYQAPYIPASSLKGLLRSYMELKGVTCRIDSVSYDVGTIMGSQEHAASIVLSDALPTGVSNVWRTLLEPEVTTPIYADGTDSPRIEEHRARPNPVIYPVIARSVVFDVIIGIGRGLPRRCWDVALREWLQRALLMGFGRKTSLSYGMSGIVDIVESG